MKASEFDNLEIDELRPRIAADIKRLNFLVWGKSENDYVNQLKKDIRPWPKEFKMIMDSGCEEFGITLELLCRKTKRLPKACRMCRMAIGYLIREITGAQFWEIGCFLGQRSSGQISAEYKLALSEIQNNPEFAVRIEAIKRKVIGDAVVTLAPHHPPLEFTAGTKFEIVSPEEDAATVSSIRQEVAS